MALKIPCNLLKLELTGVGVRNPNLPNIPASLILLSILPASALLIYNVSLLSGDTNSDVVVLFLVICLRPIPLGRVSWWTPGFKSLTKVPLAVLYLLGPYSNKLTPWKFFLLYQIFSDQIFLLVEIY